MAGRPDPTPESPATVETLSDLARALRELRRRQARRLGAAELTYRELAERTGWSHAIIGEYLAGTALPPVDRFDVLVQLLGAAGVEQGMLATARDRVEERRRGPARPPAGAVAAPRQLPAAVAGFTGRGDQLAELDRSLATADRSTVSVAALCGTAGVGKTALAVRWAHRVEDRFPDGQLYVDLRGYDPGKPLSSHAALAGLLRGLGTEPADIPADLDECAARFRSSVSGRRILVVLDNARSADQVRLLLPGAPSCFVLVTSRDDLAGLVAREGARRVVVDLLPMPDAIALLRVLIGDRVDAEPSAAAELAGHCARLPLALRVAAEVVAARPAGTLAALLDEHRREGHRLDLLGDDTDPRSAVRTVLSWSYRQLPADVADAFGMLGLHPGQDVDAYAVAALTGAPDLAGAHRLLRALTGSHLVQEIGPGRYGMHDLLRAYAAQRAMSDLRPERRRAALGRLLDHCLCAAAAATAMVFPQRDDRRPPLPVCRWPLPPLSDLSAARDWLSREGPTLLALSCHAADHDRPEHAIALSRVLWRYLDIHSHNHDALAIHGNALRAAVAVRDDRAANDAEAYLGRASWRLGLLAEAANHDRRAIEGYRRLGDHVGRSQVLSNLAGVEVRTGRYAAAAACLEEALAISRDVGDRVGEGGALANLSLVHWQSGRSEQGLECAARAKAIGVELGDRRLVGTGCSSAGLNHERTGRNVEALAQFEQALAIRREIGDRFGEAADLVNVAGARRLLGHHAQALAAVEEALVLGREIGDPSVQTEALNEMGEILCAAHRPEDATARHGDALALARRWGDRQEEARALEGLAETTGSADQASRHRVAALAIYTDLGVPEAEALRARLRAMTATPPARAP